MNDNQIQTFLAAADTGSFSRAEEKLYISKQAIRKQIDALEKEIGAELFLRTSQGLRLTEAGALFYAGARALLEEKQQLVQRCRQTARTAKAVPPLLRLLVPPHPRLLMEAPLALYAQRYPESRVQIVTAQDDALQQRLLEDQLDLAECAGSLYRSQLDQSLLDYIPIVDLPYLCLMAPGHPLAQQRNLTADTLEGYTVTVDRFSRRGELCAYLQEHGATVAEFEDPDDFHHLLEQIMNVCYAHGIFCTTAYYAAQMNQLAVLRLDLPPKDIGLVYLRRRAARVGRFIECALECRKKISSQIGVNR